MTTHVLAAIPSPPQGVWELGPFPMRAYALCIIAGIVVACWWGERRWQARGGREGMVLDVALWAVPLGLVGARIYHVCTDWWRYFGEGRNPVDALKIWDGGLGIWGGIAFGVLGAWLALNHYGVRSKGAFADAVAPGVVLAQGIGRLGNWFNQELYGRPTDLPWALHIYERLDPAYGYGQTLGHSTGRVLETVHPTFLYELLWNVAVCVVLVVLDRRLRLGRGRVFALYVALYCFGRFWVELMRTDTATHVLGLRINTLVSAAVLLGAVVYLVRVRGGREDPAELATPDEDTPAAETAEASPATDDQR